VDQFDTEIRMCRRPRHVVPPIQHVPSRWTSSMTRSVRSSDSKCAQDLVQHERRGRMGPVELATL
jgi:hypothetical protein